MRDQEDSFVCVAATRNHNLWQDLVFRDVSTQAYHIALYYKSCLSRYGEFIDLLNACEVSKYVITLGTFNNPLSSKYPETIGVYGAFLRDRFVPVNSILVCTELAVLCSDAIRGYRDNCQKYIPFIVGDIAPRHHISTPFGEAELSNKWYSIGAHRFIVHRNKSGYMTRSSELDFWYSEGGFLYLAFLLHAIRDLKQVSYRIVIFDRDAIKNRLFWKLMFLFNRIGFRLIFFTNDDFGVFCNDNRVSSCEIFSFSGDYSFVKMGGKTIFSDNINVGIDIMDAHDVLFCSRQKIDGFESFCIKFFPDVFVKTNLEQIAISTVVELELFLSLGDEAREIELFNFYKRWRLL